MKNLSVYSVFVSLLLLMEPALAGPGGKIASAMFETPIGRIVLAVLTIIFLPLILYVMVIEKLAERRTLKDLQFMSKYGAAFDWLRIRERAKDCFYRVHSGWENEDLANVSGWMTDWYWQNQQMVHLDRWKRQGLVNICVMRKIKRIRPLLFAHQNHDAGHEASVIFIAIEAEMQDYLQERSSGKLVEGSKKFKDVETVWTFTLHDGAWKVSGIEEGTTSLQIAKLARTLDPIETTVSAAART